MRRHSHTEIADRLFSLMKKHFESDNATRVLGCQGFDDMVKKFTDSFSANTEAVQGEAGDRFEPPAEPPQVP